ncbi:MAG: broad specificity phosphatase PhoE [Planctomycetota bacterium]|jgi:broad specificity phosphatase PhoE
MKNYFILILLTLGFLPVVSAQESNDIYTIYLVRHAEKDFSSNDYFDPPLTQCGEKRADYLSRFLRDVDLDIIYSTDFVRTKNTAQPTATAKGLEINLYDSQDLVELSKTLIDSKKDILVVGHSFTTGALAGLLVGEEIGAFGLDIYNRVYQVVIYKDNGRLHLLHSSFECED